MRKTCILVLAVLLSVQAMSAGNVRGRVMCQGRPVHGVRVSDGKVFATTGSDGRYDLQSDKTQQMVFLIVPSGYTVPLKDGLRPDFWQYLVLPPDKEEMHDFILLPQDQKRYRVILSADVHLADEPRRNDIERFLGNTVPLLRKLHDDGLKQGPVFTIDLGDLTHDFYWYQFGFRDMEALRLFQDIGIPGPFYAVAGNHDHDPSIVGENVDWRAGWMQRECWGPDHYSRDIGDIHWVFLDNMLYINREGKGRKAPGVNGDRYCPTQLRQDQIDWLIRDLAGLSPETKVYICAHGPVLFSSGRNGLPKDQLRIIDNIASSFTHGITFFTGHWHRWGVGFNDDYPHIVNNSISATSGDMWETLKDWKITSGDGSDAGLAYLDCVTGEIPTLRNEPYVHGHTSYRVYDMNEVRKAYLNEPLIYKNLEKYPKIVDYGSPEWKNMIVVNYWRQQRGDVVEVYEKGKKLQGERTMTDDPTKYFAWDVQVFHKLIKKGAHKSCSVPYTWEFKARKADTPITVVIKDKDGKELFRDTYNRPVPFDPKGDLK